MKVVFSSTTGRIHRSYADSSFDCPLGPNETAHVFDDTLDPSTRRVDLSTAPNYVMRNQDSVKVTATSGSISGQTATDEGTFDVVVGEAVNLTIQKVDGETQAEMTDVGDNEDINITTDEPDDELLASLDIVSGSMLNGVLNVQLLAPAEIGTETVYIHGHGLHTITLTLNYVAA